MTRRGALLTVGAVSLALVGLSWTIAPRLVWNATASAPEGLYWLEGGAPKVGDLVAVRPSTDWATWLDRRGYLPRGALLIKRVAAAPSNLVCRSADHLSINHRAAARTLPMDAQGRPLPVWSGCIRLAGDQVLLLNAHPRSLDGRYFGPTDRAAIVGRATPLWLLEER